MSDSDLTNVSLEEYIQQTLWLTLKEAFKRQPQFPYSDDPMKTRIQITTEFPKKTIIYPCIVIHSVDSTPYRYIGETMLRNDMEELSVINAGNFRTEVTLSVAGETSVQRRQVRDRLIFYLWHKLRGALATLNLAIAEQMVNSGSREESVGEQYIYYEDVKMTYFVSWWETTKFTTADIVQTITHVLNDGIENTEF